MNLRTLECFFALSRELHFGRAAAGLYISQSTLSETIRALEENLGGRLFERTSRRVELTDFGRHALDQLEPASVELSAAIEACRTWGRSKKSRLQIGFLGGGFYELHRPFVREFAAAFPAIDLTFVELTYETHFTALAAGDVDIALCRLPVGLDQLSSGPILLQDQRVLCVPAGHPLTRRQLVDPEELAHLPMCSIPAGATDAHWREYHFPRFTPAGQAIPPGPVISTIREGISAASTGEGVLMLTKRAVDYYRTPHVDFVDIDLPPMPTALVRRSGDHRPLLRQVETLIFRIAQRHGTAPVPATGTEYHHP